MALALFSPEWAAAWCERINASDAFRRAGARWEDSVAFVLAGAGRERVVRVDLHQGRCREARAGAGAELDGGGFVIAADASTWRDVLSGHTDLVMAVMRGRFTLRAGTLAALLPHAAAAHALLAAVQEIDTEYA